MDGQDQEANLEIEIEGTFWKIIFVKIFCVKQIWVEKFLC